VWQPKTFILDMISGAFIVAGIAVAYHNSCNYCAIALVIVGGLYVFVRHYMNKSKFFLTDRPVNAEDLPFRSEHDKRRHATYPHHPAANTWYQICDSDELKDGKVVEVRALDHVFAVWRADDGTPVCQSAFCLHLGANLAVGGKVVDGCVQCPFHKWRFDKEGCVKEIPYIQDQSKCPKTSKLKTYPCVDWCGLVCMYFHADDRPPEYSLPAWVPEQMEKEGWVPHMKWDIGFLTLTPTDWVDQAGDHAHFHTLHNTFLIPYTLIPIPDWLLRIFPLGITHELVTYKGDDADWAVKMKECGMGCIDKHLMFFTDRAGLSWNGVPMETTVAETLEMYIGPAMMSFHIPFTIGKTSSPAIAFPTLIIIY
jgi:nitrite reductase/ring-hydroxylating ferredoxin subunit